MPGKKPVAASQPDDVAQIRIRVEQMRSENRLTADAVETLGRQQSLELRAVEARLGARLEILEVVGRSHGAELHGLNGDVAGLKTDVRRLDDKVDRLDGKVDKLDERVEKLDRRVERLEGEVESLDNKVDKLVALDARVAAIEHRSS
jgi:peptidoglycan hydrolase CwlO-like protein